jgi:dTMP kinase
LYFLFEGTDGCGKTTIMKAVAMALAESGKTDFVLTKEPGGPAALWTEWGKPKDLEKFFGLRYDTGPIIRDLCVNHPEVSPLAKRALYMADSLSNWDLVVKPAIADDCIVLSDRGWISDLAYGNVLCKIDLQTLYQFNMALRPQYAGLTYVIYLDVPTDVREARLSVSMTDHMDRLGKSVRDLLDQTYKMLIPTYIRQGQYWFVDASDSIDTVTSAVLHILREV